MNKRTLKNSTIDGARKNVKDIAVFGDGDTFKLISKASSENEGWMKSTKAMQINGVGCLVQVTTLENGHPAEALSFVPDCIIEEIGGDKANGRKLVAADSGNISDGYHTFDELYKFRLAYNAALFNAWHAAGKYETNKSKKHDDGSIIFDGDYFIVSALLPSGLISNHYHIDNWSLFNIKETEESIHVYDGHSPLDVIDRLNELPHTLIE